MKSWVVQMSYENWSKPSLIWKIRQLEKRIEELERENQEQHNEISQKGINNEDSNNR